MTAAALPFTLYADLIGKPFEPEARGPHAYDCVGLAAEIQRRRGFVLPAYLSTPAELHRQLAAGGVLDECHRIEHPIAGCIALMRSSHVAKRHIGIMIDPFRMIHASEAAGSVVVESIGHTFWGKRILGFYSMDGAR